MLSHGGGGVIGTRLCANNRRFRTDRIITYQKEVTMVIFFESGATTLMQIARYRLAHQTVTCVYYMLKDNHGIFQLRCYSHNCGCSDYGGS